MFVLSLLNCLVSFVFNVNHCHVIGDFVEMHVDGRLGKLAVYFDMMYDIHVAVMISDNRGN